MPLFPTDNDPDIRAVFQVLLYGPPHLLDLELQGDLHAILSSEGLTLVTKADRPLEADGEVGCVEIKITDRPIVDLLDLVRRNLPRGIMVDCSVVIEAPATDDSELLYYSLPVHGDPLPGLI